MIWRLTYCNKKGVEARIDIIKGDRTPVEIVQGSGQPFTLSYKLDKNDKSGHIMTSSADIEIFETDTFNIDDLKTSNETELKVEYFEDNILTWSGFVLPDFFSREIGSPNIVRMTASDRLTALKGVALSDLPSRVSLRDLIELSLEQTGLNLGLVSQIQINQGSTNILDSEILSQRLTDVRGRSISCYDILMSIMVGTNSTIRQRAGQWQVYNKLEHELRTPTIFFDKVERGAIRTIQPVASSVGVYQEYGGGRLHPDNYDFAQGLSGWSTVGGFNAAIGDKLIKEFTAGSSGGAIISIVPDNNVTIKPYLINNNEYIRNINPKYIESANIDIPYTGYGVININVDVNATGPAIAHPSRPSAFMRIAVVAIKGTTVKTLDHGGAFINMPSENPPVFAKEFERGTDFTNIRAVTSGMIVNGKLEIPEGDSFSNWKIRVRVYGSGGGYDVAFNSTMVKLSLDATDSPKGNIFKTTQGANYTKLHDVETTIFGDYITSGLNGYFYDYPIDDTSNLHLPNGELSPPEWKTVFDTTERPLLHHISRQKSRLFSVAHDILKANINVDSFDPLAVFQDCKGGKYVVVSASFDFLRSEVDVELEQIAYDNTILKRDFIYSYFGEGEDTIKSIGGIAGGGGGTGGGGGMTSEQLEMLTNLADWWKLDEENDAIYSEKSVYSLKGVSALGLGEGGGGGEGTTVIWGATANNYSPLTVEGVMKMVALAGHAHTVSDVTGLQSALNAKQNTLIAGTNITISGDTISASGGISSVAWGDITGKPSTFAPSAHTHSASDITSDTLSIARIPTGTTGTTVALGNDSRIVNGQTAYGWGNHASAGYALNSALTTHTGNTTVHITATERTNWNKAYGWGDFRNFGLGSTDINQRLVSDANIDTGSKVNYFLRFDTTTLNKPTQGNYWEGLSLGQNGYQTQLMSMVATAPDKPMLKVRSSRATSGWSGWEELFHTGNLTKLSDLTDDIGIVDLTSTQTIAGTKTFTKKIGANLGVKIGAHSTDGLIEWDATNNAFKFNGSLYATGGISALGLGSGGSSGGGVDMLDDWTKYTTAKAEYYVPASLLVDFRSTTITDINNLKSGSATSIVTTGSGNAITSLTKAGSVITANKGLTFLETSIFNTHNTDNIRHITGAERTKWDKVITDFDNLEIGGRNLIRTNMAVNRIGYDGFEFGYYSIKTKVTSNDLGVFLALVEPNTKYIITFKGNDIGSSSRIIYYDEYPNDAISDEESTITGAVSGRIITTKANTKYVGVGFYAAGRHPVEMYEIKLEKGNKPTDWSPAPEDQVSDWLTTDVNSFSFIKNKPTLLSQFTDNIGIATHIANTSNPHSVTKSQVGLSNVDNTSDLLKPISNAVQTALNLKANLANPTFTGNVTAPTFIGALTGNASSATKLQTARTIWGQSFNGEEDVLGALTGATTGSFSASVSTPKVDFGNGFTIEPSGTELVFKYNGVIKQRMLSDGTILAVAGITALTTT